MSREEFLADLLREYHDDDALRDLTDPPAPPETPPHVLRELAEEGWFGAEMLEQRLDLYGDLD